MTQSNTPYKHAAYGDTPPSSTLRQVFKPRRRTWRDWVYIIGQLIISSNPLTGMYAVRDLKRSLETADRFKETQ